MSESERSMHLNATPEIFIRAKKLRAKMTISEKILWEKLKDRQIFQEKFRRQHPILKFILDFYCHEVRLGVEIDGKQHNQKFQKYYDEDRTQNLKINGVKVIRFTNDQIKNSLDQVIDEIHSQIRIIREES